MSSYEKDYIEVIKEELELDEDCEAEEIADLLGEFNSEDIVEAKEWQDTIDISNYDREVFIAAYHCDVQLTDIMMDYCDHDGHYFRSM